MTVDEESSIYELRKLPTEIFHMIEVVENSILRHYHTNNFLIWVTVYEIFCKPPIILFDIQVFKFNLCNNDLTYTEIYHNQSCRKLHFLQF